MNGRFIAHMLSSAVVVPWLCSGSANAQSTEQVNTNNAAPKEDIVVTGTRIVQSGYNAPVPLNVLGTAEIEARKPSNIADLVLTMPAATGGTTTTAGGGGRISAGTAGISTLNLRALGSGRTLVLLDGRRTPPSTFGNLVDINTIPQDLVKRVDIVTGGASAQYGSDAVGGVVNFILDDSFRGFKLGADTSITTYGDGLNYRFTGTAGLSFLDDRIHILANAEYFHQDGINTVDRPWNTRGYYKVLNPAYTETDGQPQYLVGPGVGQTRTVGGLINSGPLRGTHFLDDGITGQFDYGTGNSVSSPGIVGGDWRLSMEGVAGSFALMPTQERMGVFNHVDFDVTPDLTLYGQFSWHRFEGQSFYGALASGATIAADNAFLLTQYPQVAAAMQANGLGSVPVSTWIVGPLGADNSRQVFRYLAGAKGRFSLLERPWSWDAYYQRGVTKTHEQAVNSWNTARLALGTDAVLSNGQIVCRSTLTDPTNGCVPLDRLGTGGLSPAARAYLYGPGQPLRRQTFQQEVVSATLNGQLFDLPGGPVAIALGGEWRKDQASGRVANTSSGWVSANYRPNFGKATVKEAFLEASLPVFTGFDLNAAGRYTDYSASGTVQTWKVGATFSPISDIMFRGSYSRDIRAPNLSELFQDQQVFRTLVTLPANSPAPGGSEPNIVYSGNPDLKPERANTLTAGVVVKPSFLPGLSASIDYWDIKLDGAIGSVDDQPTIDYCYSGVTQFCNNLVFSGNQLISILSKPINFGKGRVTGLDFEASYGTPLSAISESLPGTFRIHAAATHYIRSVVDDLVLRRNYAGVLQLGDANVFATPSWVYRISAFYDVDPISINLVARGFSNSVYSNEYIECTSNCPTSTVARGTINDNDIDGAMYLDGSVSLKFRSDSNEMRLSFIVDNILNRKPTPVGNDIGASDITGPQTAQPFFNTLGRVFRLSLTSKF